MVLLFVNGNPDYTHTKVLEADKFAGQCEPFFAAFKESNITILSLKNTGMGPVAVLRLATSFSAVGKDMDLRTKRRALGSKSNWNASVWVHPFDNTTMQNPAG